MRRFLIFALAIAGWTITGCGGCERTQGPGDGQMPSDAHIADDGGDAGLDPDVEGDAGPGGSDSGSDAADAADEDAGGDADAGGGDEDVRPADMSDDAVCGNAAIEDGEICDDGNTDDGDYCSGDCQTETGSCGDSARQMNEACDDGNTEDGDYCSADCLSETGSCGDGVTQQNENCDDGVTTDCTGTHDGGDGTCVPVGTCSDGYVPDGNGACVANPTGLSEPCQNGDGWTLFRFHYDSGSTSARIDVWDATCTYSFGNPACNVQEVCSGFCDVQRTSQGYPVFTSSDYLRVRFNVNGLNFSEATFYIQARSYATSSSTYYEAWSPLYGGLEAGPVDQDFVYDWYGLDWTGFLYPSDDPDLTAIQLYAGRGSGSLAVKAVELCVQ